MADYIENVSNILFFVLDHQGHILRANRHARTLFGPTQTRCGRRFSELIHNPTPLFSLEPPPEDGDEHMPPGDMPPEDGDEHIPGDRDEQVLHLTDVHGETKSFLFRFVHDGPRVLAFGRTDTSELERMNKEVFTLNQEVVTMSRELNKQNEQLRRAFDHIKTLQGILPICMHCHRIRNEQQAWAKLEEYIETHTDAAFSHSICDECLEKHYPEEEDENAEM